MSKYAKDLLKLSGPELAQRVDELRSELIQQKRARAAGELLNSQAIKKTRRSIAVALTRTNQMAESQPKKEETK